MAKTFGSIAHTLNLDAPPPMVRQPGLSLRVLVIQHCTRPGYSLFVYSTHDPDLYDVWEVAMPFHSLSYPIPNNICKLLLARTPMDPHNFVRLSQPGKVLFVFQEKYPHPLPYVDVYCHSTMDLPAGVGEDRHPLWLITRFYGNDDPYLFWRSDRQVYMGFAEPPGSPTINFRYFVNKTRGLRTLENWLLSEGGAPVFKPHRL